MAAAAIIKNPDWAESKVMTGLLMEDEQWIQSENSSREIILWENFDKVNILNDFYDSLQASK